MANVTLPYTLANGNTADGGQVQQNFDAIVTQVNGNLDSDNLASGAVTLAKLATDVKVIENVYSAANSAAINLPNETVTTILSQELTLPTARYCLFLYTGHGQIPSGTSRWEYELHDGSSVLDDWEDIEYNPASSSENRSKTFHYFSQLSSGTHTIYFKIYQSSGSSIYYGIGHLTIIQFAF